MTRDSSKKNTLKKQIYASVLTDIMHSVYLPDQVITEKALMEKFDVSRAPVREALVELCNENILHSIPCYGYKVTPLSQEYIKSVQEYRITLECGFMSRSWNCITPEHLKTLEDIMFSEKYRDGAEYDAFTHWENNIEFHLTLMSCYNNDYALGQLRSALTVQKRAYAQILWERWHKQIFAESAGLHQEILRAIRKNNLPLAMKLLESDIRSI
ncbi:GntR family transcriptional regulator [Anaerolentibacter hominis]|uniref:GntR family transcriptional regulator n=1 Tax=Anaerolentibacter hominis TaxID=3079009 RepID=UPI0031B8B01F